jgi:hypothetical protein
LGLNPAANISTGFSVGITSVSLSGNEANPLDPNDDPAFGDMHGEPRKIHPTLVSVFGQL